ncbi:periplasmic binding protein domain-containing protein [Paenibacillus sp. 32O-W]|uniref:substrate-binding domain-containing protein n=1 Tax=Paenibacillus sp. 32O-W TaxID=1695218 RepID=UPI00072301B2|nr:substrate-binding domain-containing protein [Paenibacillus sp. 32O-W]ALS28729.1 periplasmic binding protein domain-containing protein [Paenibacillus sp. 32O-W]
MKYNKLALVTTMILLLLLNTACGNNDDATDTAETGNKNAAELSEKAEAYGSNIAMVKQPPWYQEPTAEQLKTAKLDNASDIIVSSGPYGEEAVPASKIIITEQQAAKIKEGKFTAAIAMGFLGDDWSEQQLAGLKSEFGKLGIEVVAETNANFKDTTQISDLQAIAGKKPDIVVSIPLNAQTTAKAYQALADAGAKIVFMDQPAEGMVAGKDYVSVVSADSFGLGMNIADELARAIGGKGEVAALYYAPNFYVTNQRYQGFVARLAAKYPDIKLVEVQGFQDPNRSQEVAAAILTKYPNLKGMYASWDVPAMGAVAAARVAGKTPENFKIVNENLGNEVALNMAQNGFIAGIGSQRPFDQGVAEARLAALAMIGEPTPAYVAVPSLAVNRENLENSYKVIYHKDVPPDILEALKK